LLGVLGCFTGFEGDDLLPLTDDNAARVLDPACVPDWLGMPGGFACFTDDDLLSLTDAPRALVGDLLPASVRRLDDECDSDVALFNVALSDDDIPSAFLALRAGDLPGALGSFDRFAGDGLLSPSDDEAASVLVAALRVNALLGVPDSFVRSAQESDTPSALAAVLASDFPASVLLDNDEARVLDIPQLADSLDVPCSGFACFAGDDSLSLSAAVSALLRTDGLLGVLDGFVRFAADDLLSPPGNDAPQALALLNDGDLLTVSIGSTRQLDDNDRNLND